MMIEAAPLLMMDPFSVVFLSMLYLLINPFTSFLSFYKCNNQKNKQKAIEKQHHR